MHRHNRKNRQRLPSSGQYLGETLFFEVPAAFNCAEAHAAVPNLDTSSYTTIKATNGATRSLN